jgi:hypothetical protein
VAKSSGARSIKRLEGGRWRLRRMQAARSYGISIYYRRVNKAESSELGQLLGHAPYVGSIAREASAAPAATFLTR